MKERPIPFQGEMVRAILAGTKTQTRRIAPIADMNIKPHSDDLVTWGVSFTKPVKGVFGSHSGGRFSEDQARSIIASRFCPYGQPGDCLWVQEAHWWFEDEHDPVTGYSPPKLTVDDVAFKADGEDHRKVWRPSIHMPRWASRITLEITGVRVERLQDISEADAVAEGARCWVCDGPIDGSSENDCACFHTKAAARDSYRALWEQINGPGSWDANPWVWCIEFKRVPQGEVTG